MITSINPLMKKVRIIEVIENRHKYFLVQRRLYWFLWESIQEFKTIEEAKKCAKDISEELPTKMRVV